MQIGEYGSGTRRRVTRTLTILLLLVLLTPGLDASGARAASFMVAHPVPWSPLNLAIQAPGVTWVTFPDANLIGRLVVEEDGSSEFVAFMPPTADSEPYDIILNDSILWFTQRAGNRLGRLNISDTSAWITEYVLPTPNSRPTGLAVGPDGRIWILEQAGNKLAVFDPDTSAFEEIDFPPALVDTGVEKIAVRSDNTVWLAAPDANLVVSYDATNGNFAFASTISPTGVFTRPVGITLDVTGRPWVAAQGSDAIGRYTPETLSFWRWFKTPRENGGVVNVSILNAGARWRVFFTEADSGSVGFITVRSSDTRFLGWGGSSLPAADSRPWDVEVDATGDVWITDTSANAIVQWQPPYVHHAYMPRVHR